VKHGAKRSLVPHSQDGEGGGERLRVFIRSLLDGERAPYYIGDNLAVAEADDSCVSIV
jgi:hypothetical protein